MKLGYFSISLITLLLFTGYISASDTNLEESKPISSSSIDPFEAYNRHVFRMNMKIDSILVRPAAVWYVTYAPTPVQGSTTNFFNNLRDFVTLGNDILQLNGMRIMSDIMRVSINSTIGIFGIIDVSTSIGLNSNKNTFGRTMKVYGWKHSNYFVIPFLGPSTVRDALGMIPDTYFNPTWYVIDNIYVSLGFFGISALDTRAKYLDADKLLYTSLDPYITMRDLYLQSTGETSATTNNDASIDSILNEPESMPTTKPQS
ncbi:MAG: VacJ family lipoprotein [Neisseriaceae bacterium]